MPSQAQSDQTQVRFLHAVAGAGPASLVVEAGHPRLPSSFAKPSGYQVFRPGQARLRLILNGQSSPLVSETVRLGPGKHTVVAVGDGKNVDLLVYRDGGVEPGKATLRAIHVAAEVGKADVTRGRQDRCHGCRTRRRHRLPPGAARQPLRRCHSPRRRGRSARQGGGPCRRRHRVHSLRGRKRRHAGPGRTHRGRDRGPDRRARHRPRRGHLRRRMGAHHRLLTDRGSARRHLVRARPAYADPRGPEGRDSRARRGPARAALGGCGAGGARAAAAPAQPEAPAPSSVAAGPPVKADKEKAEKTKAE